MKGGRDARSGASVINTVQSQQQQLQVSTNRPQTTHHKLAQQQLHVPGSSSLRKSSNSSRPASHQNAKTTNATTAGKARQSGSSVSGNRSTTAQTASQQTQSALTGTQPSANLAQYGLVSGVPARNAAEQTACQGGMVGAFGPNLICAKGENTIANHQKTKSTHLPSSYMHAQLMAPREGSYANNTSQASAGIATKAAGKHQRHESNPSWILLQGANNIGAQAKMSASIDVPHSISVQMPKSQQVTISETPQGSKSRSKQINQSQAMNPGHQRFNSTKFGSQTNTSKIQKVPVSASGEHQTMSYSVNTTGTQGSAPSVNKAAGHKKSASMANSKIAQLLLKAGSKHYIQQQNIQMAAAAFNQNQPHHGHASQAMPQKQKVTTIQVATADNTEQVFVSSYDRPTLSSDLLLESGRQPANSSNQVYANINKSMDMVGQTSAFNHQFFKHMSLESSADQQLQKLLQTQDKEHSSFKQESSYQEPHSKYFVQKTAPGMNNSSEATQQHPSINATSHSAEASSAAAPQNLQFFHQLNANQLVNAAQGPHDADKISRQGKVVSSSSISVKKPSNLHVKTPASVSQKPGANVTQPGVAKQKLAQHGTHQRTKSDQAGSEFTLILNMGKVIKKQKGKVGEILKNNFLEIPQPLNPGSMPNTLGKEPKILMNISHHMKTYTGGERSKATDEAGVDFTHTATAILQNQIATMVADGSRQTDGKNVNFNSRKLSSAATPITAAPGGKGQAGSLNQQTTQNKSMQQKYLELESKYNELLQELECKKNVAIKRTYSPIEHQLFAANNQASLSSLQSNHRGSVGNAQGSQSQAQASQMNPRIMRYLNNQMKMKKGEASQQEPARQARGDLHPEPLTDTTKNHYIKTGFQETRSADTHAVKLRQNDLSKMMIAHPFDDGNFSVAAPPNSQTISQPNTSTAAMTAAHQVGHDQITSATTKRSHHNRVSTHYYGQQLVENSNRDISQASSKNLTREELAQLKQMKAISQIEIQPSAKASGHSHSLSMGQKSTADAPQPRQSLDQKMQSFKKRYQIQFDQATSRTQQTHQTPRTLPQPKEKVAETLMRQPDQTRLVSQSCARDKSEGIANVARHTRMLLQNQEGGAGLVERAKGDDTSQKMRQSTGGKHRRSVSDGNDPNNFNFKQANINPASNLQNHEQKINTIVQALVQQPSPLQVTAGKHTLASFSIQQRMNHDQDKHQFGAKGKNRSQSRSKNVEHSELMIQAPEISSLDSQENYHHQPNSQLLMAQIAKERKTQSKKAAERSSVQQPNANCSKESFLSKQAKNARKSSKNGSGTIDGRSSSRGAFVSTGQETQKAMHSRMKSNSYRVSNKDQSLVCHNDPSAEGQIQNPSNVVVNGSYLDMAHQAAKKDGIYFNQPERFHHEHTRTEKTKNQLVKNQDKQQAYYHPVQSQPNNFWAISQARGSHDMFIVQENTPLSVNSFSEATHEVAYPSFQQPNKAPGFSQSPVILKSVKVSTTNKPIEASQNEQRHNVVGATKGFSDRTAANSLSQDTKTELVMQIEKKRPAVSKNQAQSHPLCRSQGTGHIQNKLSTTSHEQSRRTGAVAKVHLEQSKQHSHKRTKSDNVESQRQSLQPLLSSSNGLLNVKMDNKVPQKERKSCSHKKHGKNSFVLPNQACKPHTAVENKNQVVLSTDQFYAANNGSDDRKLVNISIDELKDDMLPSDAEAINANSKNERSKWIEVIRQPKEVGQQKPIDTLVEQYNQKRHLLSGSQKEREKQVNEKRKKFIEAYQKRTQEMDKNIKGWSNEAGSKLSVSKKRFPSAMLIEEPNSTEESYRDETDSKTKLKNITKIARRKFKSKSHVPPHFGQQCQNQSLEREDSAEQNAERRLGQYQGIPADSQESKNKININLNIPSAIKGISEHGINGPPHSITQRSLADSDQPQSALRLPQKTNDLARQDLEERQNAPKAGFQKNNFVLADPEDKSHMLGSSQDLRIETYSSIELDTSLTSKEKIRKRIAKYVRLSYQNAGSVPLTTVDFYRIGKILGKGAFGKVNLALHHLTNQMVAIKSINKQYFSDDVQRRKVLQEVVILKQTRHKNIVRLFEYFETHKHILFVIEIAPGGDLLNYVRKRRQLKEDIAKSVFKQLISGLHYCHSKGILHRDIKLDNILLSANGEVKICDFGVSKVIRRGQILTEQCGTPAYIAPEILKDRGYEGFGVDIWSSGVVLYAMLYGIVPFRANNMAELQQMIIRAEYKLQDCISKEARDMLSGLLEKDPAKRLTTKQIMAHPWMADARDTVELFTQAERNYIRTEYTYSDKSRYNRNNVKDGGLEYESDAFVDAMLDTNENSILKNAETKSVILAPFNSTKSHIETVTEFLDQVKHLLEDRRVIKFAPRVREIAKQYEVNNNAELDNGVQHDFLEDEAKLKAAAEGEKKGSQQGIKMLDQLIQAEESQQMTDRSLPRDEGDHQPYKNGDLELHDNGDCLKSATKLCPSEIGEAKYSLAPGSATIQAQETLIVDETIIEHLIEFGYPREATLSYLNKNELNNATTAYWLLKMAEERATQEATSDAL